MKLFSTSFALVLLLSTIGSQITIAGKHGKNKNHPGQWQGWENESHQAKKDRQKKYDRNSQKDKKNKDKYPERKNNTSPKTPKKEKKL